LGRRTSRVAGELVVLADLDVLDGTAAGNSLNAPLLAGTRLIVAQIVLVAVVTAIASRRTVNRTLETVE